MSVCVEFHEKVTICNENEQTNEVVEKLINYLKQLNLHPGICEMNICRITLCADGAVFEPNKSEVCGDEAELWANDTAFAQALEAIAQAKDISFEMVWDAEKTTSCRYGIEYFSEYFETVANKERLAEFVTYRSLENWDSEDNLYAYLFGKTKTGAYEGLVRPDSAEFIENTPENTWRLATGKMRITSDDTIADEEELEEFREKAEEFAEEFNDVLELEDDEEDLISFGLCSESFELEEVKEMAKKLQYFCDFAHEHDADFEFALYFEQDESFDFQYLCLVEENGKVLTRCIKY